MKSLILIVLAAFFAAGPDFDAHPEYLFGTDMLCPTGEVALTPAPKGYKPFFISHYGRHGARYASEKDLYDYLDGMFSRAAEKDNLTPQGKEFKRMFDSLYPMVKYRTGDLSDKGWKHQQALAARMYCNFPEVFGNGALVTARTSTATRCLMTMSSFCLGLKEKSPKTEIVERFGVEYLPAILPQSGSNPFRDKNFPKSKLLIGESFEEYEARIVDSGAILGRLFKDVSRSVPADQVLHTVEYLYFFVNGMQSLESDLDFTGIFTLEERIALWKADNFHFYTDAWPGHLGYRPIVDDIIARAEERISTGKKGADLRFGHDYTVVPLLMILGVDGFGHNCASEEEIPEYFQIHRIPMGANLHIVFYRSRKKAGILFKVLLNGEEASLPLKTEYWPYYDWADFKAAYGR